MNQFEYQLVGVKNIEARLDKQLNQKNIGFDEFINKKK